MFLESFHFYLDCKNDLKQKKIIGLESGISFRFWQFPLNIGGFIIYSRLSPKLSCGLTLSFSSSVLSRLDVRIEGGSALILSKNTEGLFEKKDFYNRFLNCEISSNLKLDNDFIDIINFNRENFKDNEKYFNSYMKAAKLQEFLETNIIDLNNNFENLNFEKFKVNLENFNKNLTKLNTFLEYMLLYAVKSRLDTKYLSKFEVGIYREYWDNLIRNFDQHNILYKQYQEDLSKLNESLQFSIKQYLHLSVLKIVMNPILLIEIPNKLLQTDELVDRNRILSLINS